ncbi:MAG: PH domain-containing protein [Geobacter sp.]|nr:PH domain-containing protein [Geobacter sp.]
MGKYIQGNLIEGETVVYETNLHWITFFTLKGFLTLFIAPLIDRLTSEFAITNRRVIIKIGLVSRHILEMNLSKVESINVDQSVMGRMLKYGTITIIGTGGTREVFHKIAHPMEFRRQFLSRQQ